MGNFPSLSECKPGFVPVEFNVVILVPPTEEKTKGGIYLPEQTRETNQSASMRGLLIAVAPKAGEGIWTDDTRPMAGDEVIFAKYAGVLQTGDDGQEYRLCKDKDIIAVCRAERLPMYALEPKVSPALELLMKEAAHG